MDTQIETKISQILDRLEKLEKRVFGDPATKVPPKEACIESNLFDFSLGERPFLKKYCTGLNGQQVFVLICCFLSKGKSGVPINLASIQKTWRNCGFLDSPYRSIYSTRAKDNGWVDVSTELKATYLLRESWQNALRVK